MEVGRIVVVKVHSDYDTVEKKKKRIAIYPAAAGQIVGRQFYRCPLPTDRLGLN